MSGDSFHIGKNNQERQRLRDLVGRLSDDDLRRPANEHWTIAGVLGHIAFWDARGLVLANKLERGEPFTSSDQEPEDVTWINDATRPLIHAIAPREAARLALRMAEATDSRVASIAPAKMWPLDPKCPLNPLRASHRAEHLDEIEAALSKDKAGRTRDGVEDRGERAVS